METMTLKEARDMRPIGTVASSKNKKCVRILNNLLANEYTLFTKTLNFHWNVTGPRFHSLHAFLEKQYRDLLEVMDDVAERVRILDDYPLSTVKEMKSITSIREKPDKHPSAEVMINELLRDHLLIQEQIKEALAEEGVFDNDQGTEDFLIGLLQKHEKTSWMLKAHLS